MEEKEFNGKSVKEEFDRASELYRILKRIDIRLMSDANVDEMESVISIIHEAQENIETIERRHNAGDELEDRAITNVSVEQSALLANLKSTILCMKSSMRHVWAPQLRCIQQYHKLCGNKICTVDIGG